MPKKDKGSGGLTSIPGGKSGGDRGFATDGPASKQVIDLGTVRAQRNLDNRRSVERYFLNHMIDAFCEVEGNQPLSVEIVDVSENGCSFRINAEKGKTLPRDASGAYAPIRAKFYFSSDSYLLIGLNVANVSPEIGGGGQNVRVGCQVDETFASSGAFRQFVRFIEAFSEACSRDTKHASSL